MLQYRLYGGHSLPPGLEGFIKAAANIGSVIGQFAFGTSSVPVGVTTASVVESPPPFDLSRPLPNQSWCQLHELTDFSRVQATPPITSAVKLSVRTPRLNGSDLLLSDESNTERTCADGKELMLIIFATIGTICDPTGELRRPLYPTY